MYFVVESSTIDASLVVDCIATEHVEVIDFKPDSKYLLHTDKRKVHLNTRLETTNVGLEKIAHLLIESSQLQN